MLVFALLVEHLTVNAVLVIVLMGVNCCGLTKDIDVGLILSDLLGIALTADMLIEADDMIRGRHHQVQIVGHHQYAAVKRLAEIRNHRVEGILPADINPLDRLIEHQKVWRADDGSG